VILAFSAGVRPAREETLSMAFKFAFPCVLAAALVAAGSSGAMAARQRLAMLDSVEAGEWELRTRDGASAPRRMCLHDARRLIQLRHPDLPCNRLVVTDTPSEVTVQYTCPGQGYGRTHIRLENEGLLQIDTQGIAQSLPFSFDAEARRVGSCPR
jgi:hypothetical protein